jgi:primary-amine oxidase
VNHDHFFSFRLDLDVDGSDNSFESAHLKARLLPAGSPRRSIWVMDPHIARVERDAQLSIQMEAPALWRFLNPAARGPMGYPTAYEVVPEHNAMSLLSPDDWPQRRAGFTNHMLWVTPYRPDELYAAGLYPSQSRGTDGLPGWTAANRPIESTDIVAWYTLGFHHVVRAEDWPVMPTAWHAFELRPFDLFTRNPALDLPSRP